MLCAELGKPQNDGFLLLNDLIEYTNITSIRFGELDQQGVSLKGRAGKGHR